MHSAESYVTAGFGGLVGGAINAMSGISLLQIDLDHTLEYGLNLLIGTVIVTGVKLVADMISNRYRRTNRRRARHHAPRR